MPKYNFADRVLSLQPSIIREIFKYASVPGMIPFAAGNPDADAFPKEDLEEISRRIFETRPIDALQYSITEGYPPLRDTLRGLHAGIMKDYDDVIITSGAQQVMNLVTQSLCNDGEIIICESPSFIGSLNAFRSFNAKLAGVPMEDDGMDLNALESIIKSNSNAKFIYCIPNFQNPTGIVTSFEKRRGIYDLARRHGLLILEDNPYGDTRFAGEEIPAIKSLDEEGIVIYAGTFSKVISPGLRVGYAVAPAEVLQKMTVCKQGSDVHTNIYAQILADEFIKTRDYPAHLARIKEIYKKKAALMCGALRADMPEMPFIEPRGGLFIWGTLPEGADMIAFAKEAVERKVAVVPGNAFLINESDPCSSIRLNYSTPADEQIKRGVKILGGLLRETM